MQIIKHTTPEQGFVSELVMNKVAKTKATDQARRIMATKPYYMIYEEERKSGETL